MISLLGALGYSASRPVLATALNAAGRVTLCRCGERSLRAACLPRLEGKRGPEPSRAAAIPRLGLCERPLSPPQVSPRSLCLCYAAASGLAQGRRSTRLWWSACRRKTWRCLLLLVPVPCSPPRACSISPLLEVPSPWRSHPLLAWFALILHSWLHSAVPACSTVLLDALEYSVTVCSTMYDAAEY